jgi:hypothetical protein
VRAVPRYILTGTAGAGKTTILQHMEALGYDGRRSAPMLWRRGSIAGQQLYDNHVFFVPNLGFCEPSAARQMSFADWLGFEQTKSFDIFGCRPMATMATVQTEGWYRDPFDIHADRWISDGRPTALVRDGAVESHDPPPEVAFSGPLVESALSESESANGDDLRRADDAENADVYDPKRARQAALDSIPWGAVN